MIHELDVVVLTRDVPERRLRKGDVGTIVYRYDGGRAYEVEFVTAGARTVAVLTLSEADVRPAGREEILHVRGPVGRV